MDPHLTLDELQVLLQLVARETLSPADHEKAADSA